MSINFKDRIQKAFPGWRQLLRRNTPFIRQALVAGAVAGNVAVTAIKKGDQLISVMESAVTSAIFTDRTADFVANTDPGWIVRADGFINNTGGTATDTDLLLVTWLSWIE